MNVHFALLLLVLFSILVTAAVTTVQALPLEDEVKGLPGYDKALPSRFFSGYVPDGAGNFLWYMWSFPDPKYFPDASKAPVISLTTGGPCCSSALFFFTEAGPLLFDTFNTSSVPSNASAAPLHENKFSFTRLGHVMAISQPAGVGFSYATKKEGLTTDDDLAADRLFAAYKALFTKKFPEYMSNAYFSVGESYSGIYLLLQAKRIMEYRSSANKSSPDLFSNWRGILIGNGVTDATFDDSLVFSAGQYAQLHSLISQRDFNKIVKNCGTSPAPTAADAERCDENWNLFPFDVEGGLNIYDTGGGGWCYNPKTFKGRSSSSSSKGGAGHIYEYQKSASWLGNIKHRAGVPKEQIDLARQHIRAANAAGGGDASSSFSSSSSSSSASAAAAGAGGVSSLGAAAGVFQCPLYEDLTCTSEVLEKAYLDRADVKRALHVKEELRFGFCFVCNYTKSVKSVVPIYADIMKFNHQNNRKVGGGPQVVVLIYNGNADLAVPYTGTWAWMKSAGWKVQTEYRRYTYTSSDREAWGMQFGGDAIQLDCGWTGSDSGSKCFFATANGAGHMVPSSNGALALELVTRIINYGLDSSAYPFNSSTKLAKQVPFLANPISTTTINSRSGGSLSTGGGIAIGIVIGLVISGLFAAALWWWSTTGRSRSNGNGFGSDGASAADAALSSQDRPVGQQYQAAHQSPSV